ncbi:Sodium/glucose cotransporter [Caulifigura coniformis]|uniref:Sodium/glucose cotransporter n=1 Tax=Caulifigura coniformis TaxID=2527983 RepID=A0A517SJD9_9PLAN|nr:sodium/solute symporter [Caulifigura coniformis]QDT56239.1 Sodium/glucose cotransporter [Caulifigura coniformis]
MGQLHLPISQAATCRWLALLMACLFAGCGSTTTSGGRIPREERTALIGELRSALESQSGWPRIHAAEALIAQGYPEETLETYRPLADNSPAEERIGVWRILAQAEPGRAARRAMVERVRAAFLDPDGPDRLHAVETLAKLQFAVPDEDRAQVVEYARRNPAEAAFAHWLLANSGDDASRQTLAATLKDPDPVARLRASFALSSLPGPRTSTEQAAIADAAQAEPADSPSRVMLVGAAAKAVNVSEPFRAELLKLVQSTDVERRRQAATWLGDVGRPADQAALITLADDDDPRVRMAAANARLRIDRRIPHRMELADWGVVALYLLGMLVLGWHYSGKSKTTEDYMLGGRQMKSWTVGVSLFATIVSTISYLTWPGEVIQHGPMVLCGLLSYPLIALVVGRFLIPFFMTLRVTSAYEILESRLGVSVRLVGSLFFLTLRLLWMAVIIYTTTTKVIIPITGLDPSWTPWIAIVMGLVTIIYTAEGGLTAVVAADVVQAFILIGGAVVSMVVITVDMGGVGEWWPKEWASHWQQPILGYDPSARITLLGAFIATFTWFICTAGSDQMAIQRYLATRDLKSARRMYNISILSSGLVETFLCILGFALLAWFKTHREYLADGQSISANADQLFPRFIVVGLPQGLTGLVVAGLLAAAMSSLSSGLNSSCSVVTIDLIDRFRRKRDTETNHVRVAKFVSVAIGIIVVSLSLLVGLVQGNLLELAFKVVNLLTAPLFGLFFLAMFVPWATAFGTLVGAAAGVVTVVSINFWKELTGTAGPSFLWAMPASLVVEVAVGSLVSLVHRAAGGGRPTPGIPRAPDASSET